MMRRMVIRGLAAFAKASSAERAGGPAQPWRRPDPRIHPSWKESLEEDGLPGRGRQ
jgi:hypothetical protein